MINRRFLTRLAGLTLAAILAVATGCGRIQTKTKTASSSLILLFSIDTLRADHLSCYGYHRPTTPFIDRFASQAVIFRNAISPAVATAPAHMSIFTSLMPVVHRVGNPNPFDESIIALADNIPTWAQLMGEHGWLAYGLHGGGPVSAQFGFDRGFDVYHDDFFFAFATDYYHPGRELETIRETIRESRSQGKPLFLFLHHYLCHDPYLKAPPEFNHRFLQNPAPGLALTRADLKIGENGLIDEESFWNGVDLDNPAHLNHLIALYDGSILYSDHIFQQVVTILQQENVYKDSLIILTSDHGEEFNEHGGYRHWKLFTEILHVPLIIKFPGGEFAGRKIVQSVRTLDLLPTVLDYLDIAIDHPIQGASFLPLLTGGGEYDPPIISQALDSLSPDDIHPRESVRFIDGGYAYSNQLSAGRWQDSLSSGQAEWLFEIESDPREQMNLIETRPLVAAWMRERAAEILQRNRAFRDELMTAPGEQKTPGDALRRQLKSLGYIQ